MKHSLEIEQKFLISKKDYIYLVDLLDWDRSLIQKNYYYDTQEFDLKKQGETLRVREINGIREIQYKTKNTSTEKNTKIREEYTMICNNIPYQILNKEFPLCKFDVIQLGYLVTKRLIKIVNGIMICLDKNEYFDQIDYELEIEYEVDKYSDVIKIKEKLECLVNLVENSDGKYTRFIKKYYLLLGNH